MGAKLRAGIQSLLAQARAQKPTPFLARVIASLEQALRDAQKVD